jgi:hypothetical protein
MSKKTTTRLRGFARKTETEFLQKLYAIENYIASAAEDLKRYTFTGKTIETAFAVVYGGDQWLDQKVSDLGNLIEAQYHAWHEQDYE